MNIEKNWWDIRHNTSVNPKIESLLERWVWIIYLLITEIFTLTCSEI